MKNTDKTREEPEARRQCVAELEKSEMEREQAVEALQECRDKSRSLTEQKFELLIVDDDANLASNLQDILEGKGYSTAVANDGQTALTLCREKVFDLALIDIKLPDIPGTELIQKFSELRLGVKYIIITGDASLDTAVEAVGRREIVSYETKPLDVNRLLSLIIQVAERKQAEERLLRAAEEWRATFDSITDLVSIHSKDFQLTRVNKAFADACNMKPKELIGKHCYEVMHGTNEPIPICPLTKTIQTKKPATADYFEPRLGAHLEVTVSPIFNNEGHVATVVHVARDITERKQMEAQLMVTDRLASVGELASGIAHELNNPLTSVIGFSQLLLEQDTPEDIKDDIETVHREAQRAAEVVKNLLTFARKHPPTKQPVNINEVIEKVLALRAYEQKVNNIRVNTRLAPDLPEVMADYFQLQQAFLNITINAEHFMIEAHNKGTLTITTKRSGDMVTTSFADDGPGIPQENLGHLFDPFFTTKEVGKGTGLGLSICHGILTEHSGRIYAESEPGKGATFVVELPMAGDDKKGGN